MRYAELTEAAKFTADYTRGFKHTMTEAIDGTNARVWYNARNGQMIPIHLSKHDSHLTAIMDNPSLYGLDPNMDYGEQEDYMTAAMQHGWVRINVSPQITTNAYVEAGSLGFARKAVRWLLDQGFMAALHVEVIPAVVRSPQDVKRIELGAADLEGFVKGRRVMEASPAAIRPWLTGKCFDFALALHERIPDAEFVAIGNPKFPEHIALRRNGVYYDARGPIRDEREFLAHHKGLPIAPISREEVELHAGVAGMTPPYKGNKDIALARKAVRQIYGGQNS